MAAASSTFRRAVLAYLTFAGLLVGVWAASFPRSFAEDFPGLGRVWVAVDGPYNEHLVRDVGQLSLALAVVSLVAAATMERLLVRVAAAAWLVNAVPHLVYHLRHLEPLEPVDRVGEIVSLSLLVVLPAAVLVLDLRDPHRPRRSDEVVTSRRAVPSSGVHRPDADERSPRCSSA